MAPCEVASVMSHEQPTSGYRRRSGGQCHSVFAFPSTGGAHVKDFHFSTSRLDLCRFWSLKPRQRASTSQPILRLFLSMKPRDIAHKKCTREAESGRLYPTKNANVELSNVRVQAPGACAAASLPAGCYTICRFRLSFLQLAPESNCSHYPMNASKMLL